MPDFTARIFSGATNVVWSDPATASAPSRLNTYPHRQPKYAKVAQGGTVVIKATVGGVEGPADAALGGRLFTSWWPEWSGPYPPAIVHTAGSSSIVTVTFASAHLGHFLLLLVRDDGGKVGIHLDVEA